jgi:Protein of unknown function (DUF2652)
MDTPVSDAPEPAVLIIADISGYTRYMTANVKTLAHSQVVITELVKTIIEQIELPLELAKLEGDAVFLYGRKLNGSQPWPEAKRIIGAKLLAFFRMFSEKVEELSRSTSCACQACTHIDNLRLKIVVHGGEVLFHRVLNFLELAGLDVIIAHRLLKNSVASDQYMLMTEAARHDLEFDEPIQLTAGSETYEDIGRINTFIYIPHDEQSAVQNEISFTTRFTQSWKLFCKFWFAPLVPRPSPSQNTFHHVISSTGAAGRFSFALLTLLLTPIFLPVGMIFVFFHALKSPAKSHPHASS